jgi:hypothetical protein
MEITQDFGVMICPGCSAPLYVDIFGEVHLSESSSQSDALGSLENPIETKDVTQSSDVVDFNELESPQNLAELDPPVVLEPLAEININDHVQKVLSVSEEHPDVNLRTESPVNLDPLEVEQSPAPPSLPENEINHEEGFFATLTPVPEVMEESSPAPGAQLMSLEEVATLIHKKKPHDWREEVANFAEQSNDHGPLSYTLFVRNLKTEQLLLDLRKILEEPRLNLNSAELMTQINKGDLVIPNLNPAQTVVLVHKLLKMPVKLAWEQSLYDN